MNNNSQIRGHNSYSWLLMLLAFIFFVIDALVVGGVVSATSLTWLLPAGLAAMALSFLA
jgi:membrane-bound ClpP family serine protease